MADENVIIDVDESIDNVVINVENDFESVLINIAEIQGPPGEQGPIGIPGPPGSPGSFVVAVLSGALNGNNKIFQAPSEIFAGSELVCINGIVQDENTHYTLDGANVIFDDAPEIGDNLKILYSEVEV